MHVPNWIELEGVVNMRDLGGLVTDSGEVIADRRLLRSDNLQDLPSQSVSALLQTYAVSDVIDLRTLVEVAREGEGPLLAEPSVTHHHFTLYREDTKESGVPAAERDLPWQTDEAREQIWNASTGEQHPGHDEFWSRHYLRYLDERPDSVVAALRVIAESEGATIVHCAAGKDRTGTVVGLTLKVVGVTDEAIIADYAASAERVPRILERLGRRPAYAQNLRDKTVAQQSPTTETMRLLLAALENQYGGAHEWLAQRGWSAADTDRLRAKLLA